MFLAKYDIGNLICEEYAYTMTWYEEKTDLKLARRFLRKNKNSSLKKQLFWSTVYQICMLCMFRCAKTILLWKWLKMDIGKSKIVWSRN